MHEPWKFIYFGVKRSKVKKTRHKKQHLCGLLHSCECWLFLVGITTSLVCAGRKLDDDVNDGQRLTATDRDGLRRHRSPPSSPTTGGGRATPCRSGADTSATLTPSTGPAPPSTASDKKKKARTTFTGRQIFELEKQFEQKKYLSLSERARMAALLSVTETQVRY